MTTLEEIDTLKQQLDRHRPFNAEIVKRIRNHDHVRLTYHSIALEGNPLSESEVAVLLEQGVTTSGKSVQAHVEAEDFAFALDYIETAAALGYRTRDRNLYAIHTIVCKRSLLERAGKYRTTNHLVSEGQNVLATDLHYPDARVVPDLMLQFGARLILDMDTEHPVERAIKAHAEIMLLHPFPEGNGHTARLLMNLILRQAGFPIVVIEAQARSRYKETLISWRDGNSEPFSVMTQEAVATALHEMLGQFGT